MYDANRAAGLARSLAGLVEGSAILWDFDGVVADTEPIHERTYQVLAERRECELAAGYFFEMVGHTEEWIWSRLIDSGFPAAVEDIPKLAAERSELFAELAAVTLMPSWLALDLMPAFQPVARSQTVVSNGDPETIERLLAAWGLDEFVTVARREQGQDKEDVFRRLCILPAVVLEDSDRFLDLGRELGATTVSVMHSYNTRASLRADFGATI